MVPASISCDVNNIQHRSIYIQQKILTFIGKDSIMVKTVINNHITEQARKFKSQIAKQITTTGQITKINYTDLFSYAEQQQQQQQGKKNFETKSTKEILVKFKFCKLLTVPRLIWQ
jgi:hypothetical protein